MRYTKWSGNGSKRKQRHTERKNSREIRIRKEPLKKSRGHETGQTSDPAQMDIKKYSIKIP